MSRRHAARHKTLNAKKEAQYEPIAPIPVVRHPVPTVPTFRDRMAALCATTLADVPDVPDLPAGKQRATPPHTPSAASFADTINALVKGQSMPTKKAAAPQPGMLTAAERRKLAKIKAAPPTPAPTDTTPDKPTDAVSAAEALLGKLSADPKVRKPSAPKAKRDPSAPRQSSRGQELHPDHPDLQQLRTAIFKAVTAHAREQVRVNEAGQGTAADITRAKAAVTAAKAAYELACAELGQPAHTPNGGGNPAKIAARKEFGVTQ